jgi:hypothetical protein
LLSIVCYDKKEGNFKKCEKSQIRDWHNDIANELN